MLAMPKRNDLKSIMIIGAGPIVIGQACEFDYSGVQACRALKEEGYRIILVNSNPATIMTDPSVADATYVEPVEWRTVSRIIEKERPDAILPTMGGQTALNCTLDLANKGILKKYNVELIGAKEDAIDKAEDRNRFDVAMKAIGLETPQSRIVHSLDEAREVAELFGFPCIIRPSFTMGGSGGGIAYNREEFETICLRGLDLSPTTELLIDESLIGWKEYEMEVVRDCKDNCIIVCSIENFDAMGIHTGDSITVAPAQTLTDKEYQIMRDASIKILREIGIETGGSNVQFAVNPDNGRLVVIEMNPRVSRSSALASKATGFPIAKVAAKLAIGYTLDELRNEITGGATPSSFEPSIDYVVTKVPRFAFEKYVKADARLTTQMKSVGEVMAIGRTFKESLQKAIRGLDIGFSGLEPITDIEQDNMLSTLQHELSIPSDKRLWYIGDAFRQGLGLEKVHQLTHIDRWYLVQLEDLINTEQAIASMQLGDFDAELMLMCKRDGFSDERMAQLLGCSETEVRHHRNQLGVNCVYKRVDTCAAEFASSTAYMYSTYELHCEAKVTDKPKVLVLGGGPNRIGQGIEFDYCCVHASMAMTDIGYETIMVNCNPETVSTDYDVSDRLYFEPVTLEDVLEIVRIEQPKGIIVQFGGQTPLKLALGLEAEGVNILGTSPDAIDRAEDRERFQQVMTNLALLQAPNETVYSEDAAMTAAQRIGYPLMVRPSYVLGGRAMETVYNDSELSNYIKTAVKVSDNSPVLLDRFLSAAIEIDIDAVCDGTDVVIGGILQHIEQAGIHSGDSACSLPPYSLPKHVQDEMRNVVRQMAIELKVVGLINMQLVWQDNQVYVIEVNPRASRTVPFISKCIGVSLAQVAAKCMAGISLKDQGFTSEIIPNHHFVKEAVFPFNKFPGIDPILGPEMKSTGEVMGIGANFSEAYSKAQLAANDEIPLKGTALLSVRERDKSGIVEVAKELHELGYNLLATEGTASAINKENIPVQVANKVTSGQRPNIVDFIIDGKINLIINTSEGRQAITDSATIRSSAEIHRVYYTTTLAGGFAVCMAIKETQQSESNINVRCLQDLHEQLK